MLRIFGLILVLVLTSFYFFPFGLTFLPEVFNTKNILALVGVFVFFWRAVFKRKMKIPIEVIGATVLAICFSIICLISVDLNNTSDYSYSTYFVSFFVWLLSSFTVVFLMFLFHKKVDVALITSYLSVVCSLQCILALIISFNPEFQFWVDTNILQDQEFLKKSNRLYGIGASLDNAGVRFSIVLILISHVLTNSIEVRKNQRLLLLLIISFFIIAFIGNMISRTTTVGLVISIIGFIVNSEIGRFILKEKFLKLYLVFFLVLSFGVYLGAYLYKTDLEYRHLIRFAFEGFFNWVETGVWRTNSTDILTHNMWVWPTDLRTWLIGSGLFSNWIFNTDIGYCRFILYCGLSGLVVFSVFFVYHSIVFAKIYRNYLFMFLSLGVLTFLIWIKVSTDIFQVYALFYSVLFIKKN